MSEISLGQNTITDLKIEVHTPEFLQKLWILEWASCNVSFFVNSQSLELCVTSKSEYGEVVLTIG